MSFFDWLTIYQDHDQEIPVLADQHFLHIDTATGESLGVRQPSIKAEGSFCTSIQIRISGSRITMSGNPSRFCRLDNLFGLRSIDSCIAVYNNILENLGLPSFTKCTRTWILQEGGEGHRVRTCTDGAVITEVHVTENKAVGKGNEKDYLRGLATQRYRNSIPHLFSNQSTVDWRSKKGKARLVYPSCYIKGNEIELHQLEKIKRRYGPDSREVKGLQKVIDFCNQNGIVRFEQKIKSEWLRRNKANYWGLFEESVFNQLHDEFISVDERLSVDAMEIETIAEKLISEGIVTNRKAANTTCMYAVQWLHGGKFDFAKSEVKKHRARLRKIGIDIADPCDVSRTSPVFIKKAVEIEVRDVNPPYWYQLPGQLRLVA